MSQPDARSTQVLFREWRSGNADSGTVMAQRFADWYYAIATSRLGEEQGRGPCERACSRFGEGIVRIKESRELVSWAHGLIQRELESAGTRATDGDEPNAYTANQSPKRLLVQAREALPAEVDLLEATYSGRASPERIDELAAPLGGHPLGILKARYRVKQWLVAHAGVPFDVAPDDPILDRAPLPLYESGRMATPEEEVDFEQWMISDLDLCKDIAEFAHFAIALRGGLPDRSAAAATRRVTVTAGDDADVELPTRGATLGGGAYLGVGFAVVVLLLVAAWAVVGG